MPSFKVIDISRMVAIDLVFDRVSEHEIYQFQSCFSSYTPFQARLGEMTRTLIIFLHLPHKRKVEKSAGELKYSAQINGWTGLVYATREAGRPGIWS